MTEKPENIEQDKESIDFLQKQLEVDLEKLQKQAFDRGALAVIDLIRKSCEKIGLEVLTVESMMTIINTVEEQVKLYLED